MSIYGPGETIQLHCDIFPGFVRGENLPEIPGQGIRKRVVVTERALTILWQEGQEIRRVDVELTPEQTEKATLRGGVVGDWIVGRDNGCASCGAAKVKNIRVWPEQILSQVPRTELAAQALKDDRTYGLPSHRYSRM